MTKPRGHVGIIDTVPRADGEEAAVRPFPIRGLVGVLVLQVLDSFLREEILLEDVDDRVPGLAYEKGCTSEVRCRGEVAPAEGVCVINVLELKAEFALYRLKG